MCIKTSDRFWKIFNGFALLLFLALGFSSGDFVLGTGLVLARQTIPKVRADLFPTRAFRDLPPATLFHCNKGSNRAGFPDNVHDFGHDEGLFELAVCLAVLSDEVLHKNSQAAVANTVEVLSLVAADNSVTSWFKVDR